MANREELISSLAASVGLAGPASKYEPSRYDRMTGTLYCDGYVITGTIINEALAYFQNMKMRAEKEDNEQSRHTALIYKTAIEAILMMQKGPENKAE
ncbi:MAG: hypothetical protein K6G57_00715 [Lachnospiraceae bacterium]|nr:hypothetical protein [Lachnospiraceae bacterium]